MQLPSDHTFLQLGIFQGCAEVLQDLRNCSLFARSSTSLLHLHVSRTANLVAVRHTDGDQVNDDLKFLRFNVLIRAFRVIV